MHSVSALAALVCAVALGSPVNAFADTPIFTDDPIWTSGVFDATQNLAFGDVDGDGDLDLVFANYVHPNTLYLNENGTYSRIPDWSSASIDSTVGVALGDVDGDGDLDLACGNWQLQNTVYLNEAGRFSDTPAWTSAQANETQAIILGDVDGDGNLDLVCGNFRDPSTLYLNRGGTFSTTPDWLSQETDTTTGVALGDVDGDGDLDLVCGNAGLSGIAPPGTPNTLYLNQDGVFSATPSWSSAPTNPTRGVALGDVDGDGDLDLVCANGLRSNTLYVNQEGAFSTTPDWSPEEADSTIGVALADVDRDGDLDLVCGNAGYTYRGYPTRLYLNDGGSLGTSPAWSSRPNYTVGIAMGDVDGDGDLDLVCGNAGCNEIYRNEAALYPGVPDWSSDKPDSTGCIALGDVDGDGDLDLVCGNRRKPNTLYLNDGHPFATTADWSSEEEDLTMCVALADVDGDGDLDLACGNTESNALYLNREGRLSTVADWRLGTALGTLGMAIGDVDGDGDVDLVCGNSGSSALGHSNTVYLNVGGLFSTTPHWSSQEARVTTAIALGDVDGDCDLDLVCGNTGYTWPGDQNNLYLNTGGVLSASPDWSSETSNATVSMALADVDGDGDLDLTCGNCRSGNTVYLNTGGSFRTTPDWQSAGIGCTIDIALGDVDGDGDLDLVCANPEAPNTFHLNGASGFSTTPDWSSQAANTTYGVALGDVDADGDLDLVFGNDFESNTLYLGKKNPVYKGNPLSPVSHLPNNSVYLSCLEVEQLNERLLRVSFSAVDIESDPVWLLAEYQYEGDPRWRPAALNTGKSKIGPLKTSPAGEDHSLDWDVSYLLGDPRDVVLRLRTIEIPSRVSLIQHSASYLKEIPKELVLPPIGTSPESNPEGEFREGDDVLVRVVRHRAVDISAGSLFYRRGGERAYDQVEVDVDESLPVATIPGTAVGPRGVEYWLEVSTPSGVMTCPPIDPADNPCVIRTTVDSLAEEGMYSGMAYRMVSVPLDFGADFTGTLETLLRDQGAFGHYHPNQWRAFRYVPGRSPDSCYVEISNEDWIEERRVKPGRAFWLIARQQNRIDTAPCTGTSIPTDSSFAVTLESGWNQVGHPFAFPVDWDSVTVDGISMQQQESVGGLHHWNPLLASYEVVSLLEPFEGYFVWCDTTEAGSVLRIPPRETLSGAKASSLADAVLWGGGTHGWRIQIRASSGGVRDWDNFAGVRDGASLEWDRDDRLEPPVCPGKSLSLCFPHLTWSKRPGNYSVDIRGEYESLKTTAFASALPEEHLWGHLWSFEVAKNFTADGAADEVTLEFGGLGAVPPHAQVLLIDRELGKLVETRETPIYRFLLGTRSPISTEEDARFILLVGSEDFIDSQEDQLPRPPTRTTLHQNHPNPFNPATIIRYDIAKAGNVSLKIYDVRGALVKMLYEGHREPGRYEVGWDGENEAGQKVSPGMYFYRLTTGAGFEEARKLVLIK